MKTGKKIAALLLIFSLMMSVIPVSAADTSEVNLLNANNITVTGDIEFNTSGSNVTFKPTNAAGVQLLGSYDAFRSGTITSKISASLTLADGYEISISDYSMGLTDGNTAYKCYIQQLFSSSSKVYTDMETAISNGDMTASSNSDETTALKENLRDFIKLHNNDSNKLTNAEFTVSTAPKAITNLPAGGFMVNLVQASGEMKFTNDIISTMYTVSKNSYVPGKGGSNADGPYVVFTAPATGTYDVWANKQDSASTLRQPYFDIAGTTVTFGNSNFTGVTSQGFRLEPELNDTTVSLTKGQKVVVRILNETNKYAYTYGLVFVPSSLNETPAAGSISTNNFKNYGLVNSDIDKTATETVKVNGKEITATAFSSAASYPNIRLYNENGNMITKPTVLDAIVAADADDNSYALTPSTVTDGILSDGTFVNGSLSGLGVLVNGEVCTSLDQTELNANDIITIQNGSYFAPVSLNGKSITYTSNVTYDNNRGLSDVALADNPNFCLLISGYGSHQWPADVTVTDALRGMWLNGVITYNGDHANTSGDETEFANYVSYEIVGSAISNSKLVIALKSVAVNSTTAFDGKDFYSGLSDWSSVTPLYDSSKLYITDSRYASEDSAKVTAELNGNNVVVESKKSQPVCVTVADSNGVVSIQNYILDLATPLEISVSDGQTVRVWEGTLYKAKGTTMKPLCAPVTK